MTQIYDGVMTDEETLMFPAPSSHSISHDAMGLTPYLVVQWEPLVSHDEMGLAPYLMVQWEALVSHDAIGLAPELCPYRLFANGRLTSD